jgi:tetratricopeptide (TPR) repeat protein
VIQLLSLEGIRAGDDTGICVAVMELLAVLSAAGVRRTLVHEAARLGLLLCGDGQVGELPAEAADRALARLAGASLLTFSVDGSSVSVHRLVMRVIREQLAAGDSLTPACMAASRVLDGMAGSLYGCWHQDRPAVRDLIEQIMALYKSSPDSAADNTLACQMIRLRWWAAGFLDLLAESAAQSILIGEPLLADMERVLGTDHPDTLAARGNLAIAYGEVGRTAEAITLYGQTLADRERVLGTDDPDTLGARDNLAAAYRAAGRTAEALTLHGQTLADMERVLGTDHPDTLKARGNLAAAYRAAGRTAEALTLHGQTLADMERVLGTDHPDTLKARGNLANTYRAAGQTADAMHERPSRDWESDREPSDP